MKKNTPKTNTTVRKVADEQSSESSVKEWKPKTPEEVVATTRMLSRSRRHKMTLEEKHQQEIEGGRKPGWNRYVN